jgi:hypothetical protein
VKRDGSIFQFTLSLRPFGDIMGANISKYECPIFGNMEGPSAMDSKAGPSEMG